MASPRYRKRLASDWNQKHFREFQLTARSYRSAQFNALEPLSRDSVFAVGAIRHG
jgi:hypothetical protein